MSLRMWAIIGVGAFVTNMAGGGFIGRMLGALAREAARLT
jgi:hypothetical protein